MSIDTQVQAVADYWAGKPAPLPPAPTPEQALQYAAQLAEWEARVGDAAPPAPPEIPGPTTPGGGMPAARLTDMHAHGGVLIGPGCPKVLIGGLPAIRVTDQAACPVWDGLVPHVSGMVLKGSSKVLIAGMPAARVSDPIGPAGNCKGNAIALGCNKVLIGESPGAGGAGPGGAAPPTADSPEGGEAAKDADGPVTGCTTIGGGSGRGARPPGPTVVEVDKGTHWLEVELVDELEGPVAGESFEVRLPDGKVMRSTLDARGVARLSGIKNPGWCSMTFPRLDLAAWERWSPTSHEPPTAPVAPSTPEAPPGAVPGRDGAAGRGVWRRVRTGECLSSIADESGHAVNTIWNHDQNALLQARRRDPNVLQSGDGVFVPVLRQRSEQAMTDQRHKFRRIGTSTTLRLRLIGAEGPRGGETYSLDVGAASHTGRTAADGRIDVPIPPRERVAVLRVGNDEFRLSLGALDPISETTGVQQRLNNLGFNCGRADGRLSPRTVAALNLFRLRAGLPTSNKADPATLERLSACHDQMRPLPPEPVDDSQDGPVDFELPDEPEFDASEEVL